MGIDLSRFKVVYSDKVLHALALQEVIYSDHFPGENGQPPVMKPKFLCVLAINEDGNVVAIHDEAWRFQFIPVIQKGG